MTRRDETSDDIIIVFGGSFDPPHTGHIELPAQVMGVIGARSIIYVPAAQAPLKPAGSHAPAEHRLAMLKLALRGQSGATITTDELERGDDEPSYTVDTLETLHARTGEGVQMRLLIGSDQLRQFDRWRRWQRIVELAEPVVMMRPADSREALFNDLPRELDRDEWQKWLVDVPQMDVSSTEIRSRCTDGQSISGLVDPEVERYISEYGLYGG